MKKKVNRAPEQALIESFMKSIGSNAKQVLSQNCKSKDCADIEFVSNQGEHWVIEAKSNDSKDKHNSVHKLFGELLKETGRIRKSENVLYGLLLPDEGKEFYTRLFRSIPKDKFIAFGNIIPVTSVFCCSSAGAVTSYSWQAFYECGVIHAQPGTPADVSASRPRR